MLGWAVLGETSGRAHSDASRQTVRGRGQRQGLEASRGQQPRRGGEGGARLSMGRLYRFPCGAHPFPAGFPGVLIMVILEPLRISFSIRTVVAAGFVECFLLWCVFIVLVVCLSF